MRDQTEWVEMLNGNLNNLIKYRRNVIISAVYHTVIHHSKKKNYYGDGDAAGRIARILLEIGQ
ncbi:MAG: hypothetical protein RR998_04600 [Oscillospiraceae bacterium]